MRLELGKPVRASDGEVVGELADVIIDPVAKRVTHLVIAPEHAHGESRLAGVELAEADDEGKAIHLRCTADEARRLPNIEHFSYLRLDQPVVSDPDWDVGVTNVLALPYYQAAGLDYAAAPPQELGMFYDTVPKGEVEIRRTSSVVTADERYVGEVDGFIVDGHGDISHIVLERGHLWGRREITVPIGAVTKVESDTVMVGLSIDEIEKLPSHKVHRWRLVERLTG